MNLTQFKCLGVFSIFAVIGFGPISPGCLMGLYIVVMRPLWFLELAENLYANQPLNNALENLKLAKNVRKKAFLFLFGLFMVDILPTPVTPVIAFIIILSRPVWFYTLVINIYSGKC
jgi:hypothetical protein